jgi:hypothetical protein
VKPWARWGIVAAAVAGSAILFVVLSPRSDDGASPAPTTPTTSSTSSPSGSASPSETPQTPAPGTAIRVTYRNGAVQGPTRFTATQGEPLTIVVRADVSDEVHLHGYDLHADVAPGEPGTIELVPEIPGVFECELEDAGKLLFRLEITP